ncbi:NmrA family NAD(P)-binding protein [Pendulispora brunnea]|uniref:NmrA family NAD(P)-binding protein n=1 Tax=Pendulispora brunnea TaxID=2905690 RepID=A0ABZ2K1X4_9BACT
MFAIAGVSGNTGSVVVDTLLAKGKKVRVIVRDAKKGEPFRARGAEVAVASFEDVPALTKALEGAEGAYFLQPPDVTATDFLAGRIAFADGLARAIDASRVPHVVFLSSIGAHRPDGTGVIVSLYNAEQRLAKTQAKLTFVRAAYFFENWAPSLGAAAASGKLPTFIEAEHAMPMIATRDIGAVAAQALIEGPPAEHIQIIALEAPRAYSPRDVAEAAARALGRPVEPDFAPAEAIEPAFQSFGMSADVARHMRGMYVGINADVVRFAGAGERHVRGTTELETVVRALLPST